MHQLRRIAAAIRGHVAEGFSAASAYVKNRMPARATGGASAFPASRGIAPSPAVAPRRGRLPHFLVIGAQKAGTTALRHNLVKHPEIEITPHFQSTWPGTNMPNRKETWFFNGWGGNFGIKTLDDYMLLFNDNGRVQGEVCPTYTAPDAIERIAKTVPDAKLVYICREPVARIESAFNHMMQLRSENDDLQNFCSWNPLLSFEANAERELADASRYGLLRMGIYADTAERVLRRFPRDRLLLLIAEEYREQPQQTYDTIAAYLGIEPREIAHRDEHVRTYAARLTPAQRAWVEDFYRLHNERFFAILGREVPAWTSTGRGSFSAEERR